MGYSTFFVRPAANSVPVASALKAGAGGLENEFIQLKMNPSTGCITNIFEKKSKREMLAPSASDTGGPQNAACGNLLQVFGDKPKEYDAWNIDADFEKQYWSLDHADSVELLESGPLRSVIRVRNHFQNSSFIQDITLYAGASRIDVKMQAEWHEKHILLKVAFPISVHSQKATFEIPFGSIERPTTRNTPEEKAQFEVPAEHWADLSDTDHGVSILNDSKYGYDAKDNVLRLSLLRSPTWPDPHADEGHHEFTYSIYPHNGNWRESETVRSGYNLNYKLMTVQVLNHDGTLPPEHSFVGISSSNVVLTAVKGASDGNAKSDFIVLRFYEWAGKDSDVTLQLPAGVQSAWETNLIEQPTSELALVDGTVKVHCKPFEIKTVKVKLSTNSHE
jgi:alpha-mannosidase